MPRAGSAVARAAVKGAKVASKVTLQQKLQMKGQAMPQQKVAARAPARNVRAQATVASGDMTGHKVMIIGGDG